MESGASALERLELSIGEVRRYLTVECSSDSTKANSPDPGASS